MLSKTITAFAVICFTPLCYGQQYYLAQMPRVSADGANDAQDFLVNLPPLQINPLQVKAKPSESTLYFVQQQGEPGMKYIPIDVQDENNIPSGVNFVLTPLSLPRLPPGAQQPNSEVSVKESSVAYDEPNAPTEDPKLDHLPVYDIQPVQFRTVAPTTERPTEQPMVAEVVTTRRPVRQRITQPYFRAVPLTIGTTPPPTTIQDVPESTIPTPNEPEFNSQPQNREELRLETPNFAEPQPFQRLSHQSQNLRRPKPQSQVLEELRTQLQNFELRPLPRNSQEIRPQSSNLRNPRPQPQGLRPQSSSFRNPRPQTQELRPKQVRPSQLALPTTTFSPTTRPTARITQTAPTRPTTRAMKSTTLASREAIEEIEEPLPREPYSFGFNFFDSHGNKQSRKEVVDESGAVRGSYSYIDANGISRQVNYIADENGFRAGVGTNEPGTANLNSASVAIDAKRTPFVYEPNSSEEPANQSESSASRSKSKRTFH